MGKNKGRDEDIEDYDFYSNRETLLEGDEITNEEDGFMIGYEECMQGFRDIRREDES